MAPTLPALQPKTKAARLLETHLAELGLPFEPEVRFAPPRRWRLDYLVAGVLAVEIEGGGWVGGRHTSGAGFAADLTKYAEVTARGLALFRFSPRQILSGEAYGYLKRWASSVDREAKEHT